MDNPGEESQRVEAFDWTETKPSIATIQTLAALEGVEAKTLPTNAGITLHDHLDPDALDRVVSNSEGITVDIRLNEYQVRITESGLIVKRLQTRDTD